LDLFEQNKRIFIDFQITIGKGILNSLQAEEFIKKIKNKIWSKNCLYRNASYYRLACKWARVEYRI